MPRRRMISPNIWKDPDFAKLNDPEKVLLIGIISNSDDEGRIIATPEALKADIFPYDHKKTASVVKKLRDSVVGKMKNVCLYTNNEVEYICLLRWKRYQKPKHFKPSILPKPPIEPYPEEETSGETLGETRSPSSSPPTSPPSSRPSLGQSSLGKVRLGKDSEVQQDFTKFLDSEKDLIDCLTTTLQNYLPRGPAWAVEVLQQFWVQALGDRMKGATLELTLNAVRTYPAPVLAKAYAKAVKYRGGKYNTAKYLEKILKEKMEKESHDD